MMRFFARWSVAAAVLFGAVFSFAEDVLLRPSLKAADWSRRSSSTIAATNCTEAGESFLRISGGREKAGDPGNGCLRLVLPERVRLVPGVKVRIRFRESLHFDTGVFLRQMSRTGNGFSPSSRLVPFVDYIRRDSLPLGTWITRTTEYLRWSDDLDALDLVVECDGNKAAPLRYTFDIAEIVFVREVEDDIEAQREEWKAFQRDFSPDYSDGSKYLRPAEGNRLAKPFAVTTPDGKPACRIVTARARYWDEKCANDTTRRAAEELQRLLKRITGVEIPIDRGSDPRVSKLPAIVVGKGAFRGNSPLPKESFLDRLRELGTTDGYAIDQAGDDLYVYGAREKGALNGVYALVENNTDYIAVRPNPAIGEIFTPQTNGFSLVWGADVLYRPVFDVRGMWNLTHPRYWNANYVSTTFGSWKDKPAWTRGAHNINWYAGFKKGFARHPEWFGLVNGERKNYGNMLCFSNPELLGYFTNRVNDTMRRTCWTELAGLSMSLDDSLNWCECPNCRADLTLDDGTKISAADERFMSTQYFLFLNAVAASLQREFPGKGISTYAYFQSAIPPACPVAENIHVAFCPYPCGRHEPLAVNAAEWIGRLRGWGRKLPRANIHVYDYDGLYIGGFPSAVAHARKRDLREYARWTCGVDAEAGTQLHDFVDSSTGKPSDTARIFDFCAIEIWTLLRLYWNPDADVEHLYKKFCYRAFREAAKPMERFYGTLRAEYIRLDRRNELPVGAKALFRRCVVEPGHEDELRGLLEEARRLARHPNSIRLVDAIRGRYEDSCKSGR